MTENEYRNAVLYEIKEYDSKNNDYKWIRSDS